MKIRSGFVSNSSSSSFILKKEDYIATTHEVAYEMLKFIIEKEWKENFEAKKKEKSPIGKALRYLFKNSVKDTPLIFPWSCNEETFIYRDPMTLNIGVKTCNNHCWRELFPNYDYMHEDVWYEYEWTKPFIDLDEFKKWHSRREYLDYLWSKMKV